MLLAAAAVVLAVAGTGTWGLLAQAGDGRPDDSVSITATAAADGAERGTAGRPGTAGENGTVGTASTPGSSADDDTPAGFTSVQGQAPAERRSGSGTGPREIERGGAVPVQVRIPAIGVDSVLEDLVTVEGALQPPVDPESAGWFSDGTVPGERGPAVIAGHVDSGVAGAVFRDLDELEAGDVIEVSMSDGAVQTFHVDRSRVVSQERAQFPTSDVYGPVPDAQLRLITCHTFEPSRSAYVDNLVVFATSDRP